MLQATPKVSAKAGDAPTKPPAMTPANSAVPANNHDRSVLLTRAMRMLEFPARRLRFPVFSLTVFDMQSPVLLVPMASNVFRAPVADYHAIAKCLGGLHDYSKESLTTGMQTRVGVFVVLPRGHNCGAKKTIAYVVMYIGVVHLNYVDLLGRIDSTRIMIVLATTRPSRNCRDDASSSSPEWRGGATMAVATEGGMPSTHRGIVALLAVAILTVVQSVGSPPAAQGAGELRAGPVGPEAGPRREQTWLVPSPLKDVLMHSTLFRPEGDGPFPLAIINHGSDEDRARRAKLAMPAFPALTEWLVGRGYAVLVPQRPGHGITGGRYMEGQGTCGNPDFRRAGFAAANSIESAIDFMQAQNFVEPDGIVVIGNSAGGWAALALASRNPAGVAAVVDFSGGRGGRDRNKAYNNCAPDELVAAAAAYGRAARIPTLWLYAENDTYFAPELSRRMADAFSTAGGDAEYHLLPAVRGDGHALISTAGREATWKPPLEAFLDRVVRKRQN